MVQSPPVDLIIRRPSESRNFVSSSEMNFRYSSTSSGVGDEVEELGPRRVMTCVVHDPLGWVLE